MKIKIRSEFSHLNDVESDGRRVVTARDPPGQNCVYIPPGNTESESYRLATFKFFPKTVPINPITLSSSGFFYIGYKDRVKCYSCGRVNYDWQIGDDPTSCVWHEEDCSFINGTCARNVPLTSFLPQSPIALNQNQSLPSDSMQVDNIPSTSRSNETSHNSQTSSQMSLDRVEPNLTANNVSIDTSRFPCSRPINPHMRSKKARLQTFLDNSTAWPAHRIRATPLQIVDAGMYYLGQRDRVKCWYCNGGLQNWDQEDDPWEEHAKWFPSCEFVLQQKGQDFVQRIVNNNPGLQRPLLSNPANLLNSPQENQFPTFVDPRKEMNKINQKVEDDINNSEIVAYAIEMGFEANQIREALKREDHFGNLSPKRRSNFSHLKDVEIDGRKAINARDPPGQKSVYIPPGNPENETYRLTTFKHFPKIIPIHPIVLASAGFFYIGYKDKVKCYSCGRVNYDWQIGDDPTSCVWHEEDCSFINGSCTRNVPLASFLPQSPTALNQNQSLPSDSMQVDNIPSTSRSNETSLNSQTSSQMSLDRVEPNLTANNVSIDTSRFPCSRPINPHMRSKKARLQTFLDNSTAWPAHRIRATPLQFVDAGMYYLGQRDRVKCWYCNGGLQNWDQEDDPWEEHAKWFPSCEFVLQQKGQDFVQRIFNNSLGLQQPLLYNPANLLNSPQENQFPTFVDPRKEMNKINQKVEDDINNSEIVAYAIEMNCEANQIREALKRQYHLKKEPFSSVVDLIDSLSTIEMSENDEAIDTSAPTSSSSSGSSSSTSELLSNLEGSKKCKQCSKEDVSVVFVPCGHLVTCVGCAKNAKKCVVCKEIVHDKIRCYLS